MKLNPSNGRGQNNLKSAFISAPPLRPNNMMTKFTSPRTNVNTVEAIKGKNSNLNMAETKGEGSRKGNRKRTKQQTNRSQEYPGVYVGINFDSDSTSTSENFTTDLPDSGRKGLFPERRSSKMNFDYGAKLPLTVMQLEDNFTPGITTNDTEGSSLSIPKLTWNLASYSPNFTISETSWSRQLDIVFYRYSRDIISTIRSKIVDDWQLGNFKNYLADVCQLLEYFYCVDSILSYEASSTDPDRNPVLMQMKNEMSHFDILLKHDEARRILKNCWFPDKFSALIAWTYQNYKCGPAHQCSNYRYFSDYHLFKSGDTAFDHAAVAARYAVLIDNVTNTTSRNIISLLTQTYPEGRIGNLPLSCSESVYDEKHYESYVNQGILWPTDESCVTFTGWPKTEGNLQPHYNLYSTRRNVEDSTAFPFVLNSTWQTNGAIECFSDGCLIPIPAKKQQNGTPFIAAHWYKATNKFYAYNITQGSDDFATYCRNWDVYSFITSCQDTHTMLVDWTKTPGTSPSPYKLGSYSMSKGDFQNVYFNTNEARRVVMRDFINTLFYLK